MHPGPGAGPSTGLQATARVVIAEDEAIVRLDLKEILLSAGYEVVGETGRGDEAVSLVEEHRPDLAILDLKMPGMDGLRAAREITRATRWPSSCSTAFSQRDLIEEARDAGVSAYLVKPFQPRELLPAIADVLAKARQDWAIEAENPGEGAEDKIATRRPRRPGQADPHGSGRPPRDGGLRVHSTHRHADPGPHARRGPAGGRRHPVAVARRECRRAHRPRSVEAMATGEAPPGPLLLLDGMSLAFRAYFALPDTLATSGGVVTNAVHGFTSMLVYLIREQRPSAIAVAFDAPGATFRDEILEDYKAGRAETPWLLPPQFDMIRDVMAALAIPVVEAPGFEADDVIATIASRAAERGRPVVVVTGDRDSFQLVDDPYVRVLYNRRGVSDYTLYDEAGIMERCGVPPAQYVLLAALRGDPSDNLPGVPGVGEKTAAKLLTKYGDLDGIYAHLAELTPKLRENLAEHEALARSNARIIPLVRDVPLELDDAQLELGGWDAGAAAADLRTLRDEDGLAPARGAHRCRGPGRAHSRDRFAAQLRDDSLSAERSRRRPSSCGRSRCRRRPRMRPNGWAQLGSRAHRAGGALERARPDAASC